MSDFTQPRDILNSPFAKWNRMADSITASYGNEKIRSTICRQSDYRILYLQLAPGGSPRLCKRLGLASELDIKSCGNRPTSLLDLSVLEQMSAEGTSLSQVLTVIATLYRFY